MRSCLKHFCDLLHIFRLPRVSITGGYLAASGRSEQISIRSIIAHRDMRSHADNQNGLAPKVEKASRKLRKERKNRSKKVGVAVHRFVFSNAKQAQLHLPHLLTLYSRSPLTPRFVERQRQRPATPPRRSNRLLVGCLLGCRGVEGAWAGLCTTSYYQMDHCIDRGVFSHSISSGLCVRRIRDRDRLDTNTLRQLY